MVLLFYCGDNVIRNVISSSGIDNPVRFCAVGGQTAKFKRLFSLGGLQSQKNTNRKLLFSLDAKFLLILHQQEPDVQADVLHNAACGKLLRKKELELERVFSSMMSQL